MPHPYQGLLIGIEKSSIFLMLCTLRNASNITSYTRLIKLSPLKQKGKVIAVLSCCKVNNGIKAKLAALYETQQDIANGNASKDTIGEYIEEIF